jgi:hypothetical protein
VKSSPGAVIARDVSGEARHGNLYVAWTVFQRRQVSMSELVDLECVFLPVAVGGKGNRARKALGYLALMWRTFGLLRSRGPRVVWLQIPQVPLLWAALLHRRLFDSDVRLVADCHNGMFTPRWAKVPFGLSMLGQCDLVLVHNEAVLETAMGIGLPPSKTFVLEDVPPLAPAHSCALPSILAGRDRPWVLFPGSFGADEPIAEVLEAARLLEAGTVIMTGRHSNASANGHDISRVPPNVVMTGYLGLDDFNSLLRHCDVVLALTKVEGIQLSVCNEALGFGKAMVASDTKILRAMFGEAAVMVRSADPAAIAAGIALAYRQMEQYANASVQLAKRRRADWVGKYNGYQHILRS